MQIKFNGTLRAGFRFNDEDYGVMVKLEDFEIDQVNKIVKDMQKACGKRLKELHAG